MTMNSIAKKDIFPALVVLLLAVCLSACRSNDVEGDPVANQRSEVLDGIASDSQEADRLKEGLSSAVAPGGTPMETSGREHIDAAETPRTLSPNDASGSTPVAVP